MTKSEQNARNWLKTLYPGANILKIPDFKQTGLVCAQGYPDYLVVQNGVFFVEVKTIKGRVLRASDFTPAQLAVFPELLKNGAKISLLVYYKGGKSFTSLPNTFDSSFILAFE